MAACCTGLIVIGWLGREEDWRRWFDLALGFLGLMSLLTDLRRSRLRAIVTESDLWMERFWGSPWRVPWRQVVRVVRDQRVRTNRSAGRLEVYLEGRRRPLVLGPPLSGEQLDLLYLELLGHTDLQPVVTPPPEPQPGDRWVEETQHEVWVRPDAAPPSPAG